jgi:hypothetical protein
MHNESINASTIRKLPEVDRQLQAANHTGSEALTYNAWNLFYDAYPEETNHQQQFHVYESDEWSYEPRQLFSITNRIAKLDTSFVTLLCVRDFSLTFDHLKALISIPTLAAVVLEQARRGGVSEISARNFTDFGRAAREKSALQKLRLLIMCDFGIGRKTVLEAVSGFPCLHLIGLQNSKTGSVSDMPPDVNSNWKLLTSSEYTSPLDTVFWRYPNICLE